MTMREIFGEVISSYSRAQAIADGVLVDLMQDEMTAVCTNFYRFPIACTSAVFELMEKAATSTSVCQSFAGILHDMLCMSRFQHRKIDAQTVIFPVRIRGAGSKELYEFKLHIGPGDDLEPVITIMFPDED